MKFSSKETLPDPTGLRTQNTKNRPREFKKCQIWQKMFILYAFLKIRAFLDSQVISLELRALKLKLRTLTAYASMTHQWWVTVVPDQSANSDLLYLGIHIFGFEIFNVTLMSFFQHLSSPDFIKKTFTTIFVIFRKNS